MLKPESAGDLGSALKRMSKTHAVAMIRNKTRVIRIDPPPPRSIGDPGPPILRAFSKQDFLDLYANERYPVGDEQVSIAKVWFHGRTGLIITSRVRPVACRHARGRTRRQSLLGPRL